MVKFYVIQIKLGNITLDGVPERWWEAVAEELEEKNIIEDNNIL